MSKVGGFHNWFHYFHLELAGEINYLGHWEHVTFGGQGDGVSFTYNWGSAPVGFSSLLMIFFFFVQKPYGSMFIGTSPSLELALYTTCLLTRCKVHTC